MVHQDVKPSNALITLEGLVKITDFGLARAQPRVGLDSGTTGVESILATVASHRRTRRRDSSARGRRADVWSWAVSVLELFAGEVTWRTGLLAVAALNDLRIHGASPGRPAMPADVEGLLRRCFTTDPARRPADLGWLAEQLIASYAAHIGQSYPRATACAVDAMADGLNNKALSMVDLDRIQQAEEFWRRALAADPRHLDATFNWQLTQWREGRITDVRLVEELERFRFSLPDGDARQGRTAHLLGTVHRERGDTAAAVAALDLAVGGSR